MQDEPTRNKVAAAWLSQLLQDPTTINSQAAIGLFQFDNQPVRELRLGQGEPCWMREEANRG